MASHRVLVGAVIVAVLLAGCAAIDRPSDADDGTGPSAGPTAYTLTVTPPGHWHVFDTHDLEATVEDASGTGVAGLNVGFDIARSGSDRVRRATVAGGDVTDHGDGTYSYAYTPSAVAGYAVTVSVLDDQDEVAATSAPLAFTTSRAGEEGIRIEAGGTVYVYQVRYEWVPGHAHADDDGEVTLRFAAMRGQEEGGAIDWDRPWTNTFLTVQDAVDPTVTVTSADGTVEETLPATHEGQGEYAVHRTFTTEEVGHDGLDYLVRFTFQDPYNGATVTHDQIFPLHVSAQH